MSRTCCCAYSSSLKVCTIHGRCEYGAVVMACRLLWLSAMAVIQHAHINLKASAPHLVEFGSCFQVLLVRRIGHHKCMTVCECYIIVGIPHFAMLSTEVAVEHNRSRVLPAMCLHVNLV